ncbi:type VI secretion protein [Limoniibacter endophyticus]|uniref:Type VI secretion protein n=2 Tax=Limoniibacter endophyticus TaxID=1565040 RepID=A0A8J3GH78_9HYPH|nr:type VI secretion protein [Limoniibacter endophyticus]
MVTLAPVREHSDLAKLLETEPECFEPTTAFRVAQASATMLDAGTHAGVTPAALPVSGFSRDADGTARLRSTFAGVNGVNGSLPPAYDALVMREERNRAHGLSAFLDMFSARMAELFVDASEKYRLARCMRWSAARNVQNGFVTTLLALCGFGTRNLRDRTKIEEDTLLRFSGFFANRTRNSAALAAMLREVSGLPVGIELFRSRWLDIPVHEQSQIAKGGAVQLGINATAGAMVHDFAGSFRVIIGPLRYADYLSLGPGSHNVEALFALTRLFVGTGFDFDIEIVLRKEDVPFCQLGGTGDPPRLGWNSWARSEPALEDSRDAILREPPLTTREVVHAT